MLGTQNFRTFMVASFVVWITPGPDTLSQWMMFGQQLFDFGFVNAGGHLFGFVQIAYGLGKASGRPQGKQGTHTHVAFYPGTYGQENNTQRQARYRNSKG